MFGDPLDKVILDFDQNKQLEITGPHRRVSLPDLPIAPQPFTAMKHTFRIGLIVAATAIILVALMLLDYSRWNQARNYSLLLTVGAMLFFIYSILLQIRHDQKGPTQGTDGEK